MGEAASASYSPRAIGASVERPQPLKSRARHVAQVRQVLAHRQHLAGAVGETVQAEDRRALAGLGWPKECAAEGDAVDFQRHGKALDVGGGDPRNGREAGDEQDAEKR